MPSCGIMYWNMSTACWQASRVCFGAAVHCGSAACAESAPAELSIDNVSAIERNRMCSCLLGENDLTAAAHHAAERPGGNARVCRTGDHGIDVRGTCDDHHAHTHVERAEHLGSWNCACLFELREQV